MKIVFYGSSLLSSMWNGAATYYRGLLRAWAAYGHDITFLEPDILDRQQNRDIEPPSWCGVHVYEGTSAALAGAAARAAEADVVIVASGIGYEDDQLRRLVFDAAHPHALRIYWDVDAPATLAQLRGEPDHPLIADLARCDLVLTYGGGDPVIYGFRGFGAADCIPIYNAFDPETHFPTAPDGRFHADLSFLGNRLPDREERVERYFFDAARLRPDRSFLLAGSGWNGKLMPPNVTALGHLSTREHNAFNASPLAVLNVSRTSMAQNGYSPATRVFEAAGIGACLITDNWAGLDMFLEEGAEVLVARDGQDVAEILDGLDPDRAAAIGRRARKRILEHHTYANRATQLEKIIAEALETRKMEAAE